MNLPLDFLEFVAEHCRDPMLMFSDQGVLRQANSAAWGVFGKSEDAEVRLRDLNLYTDKRQLLTWSFLQQKKAIFPTLVSYLPAREDKPFLFRLSIKSQGQQAAMSYFLILTLVSNDGVELNDYQLAVEKFYKAFQLSPDAISITRLADGQILEVNEGFLQLTGYSREELIGKTTIQMSFWTNPEERERMREELQEKGESNMETRFKVRGEAFVDGQIRARVIDVRGETCLISVVRDLRERKIAERALQESEERLQLINHATNDAIWDWNLETDQLWWNDGIYRIFGYSTEEVESNVAWWEQKIHDEDRSRVVDRIQYHIRHGEERWFDRYRFARQDGSYSYVYDKGHIMTNDQGKPVRMVGGMVDISDRVLAEEQLLIRNRQIADYAFFNSHKVRAPLSRLLGLAEVLQLDDIEEEESKKLLAKIKITAEELDAMIREITRIFY